MNQLTTFAVAEAAKERVAPFSCALLNCRCRSHDKTAHRENTRIFKYHSTQGPSFNLTSIKDKP